MSEGHFTQEIVKAWIKDKSNGVSFSPSTIRSELGVASPKARVHLGVILGRLVDEGFIRRLERGSYQLIEQEFQEDDLTKVNPTNTYPCRIPFGNINLEDYVVLFPRSVAALVGVTNAGKTGFCFDLIKANMIQLDVWYFYCEGGPEQLVDRLLLKFPDMTMKDWQFHPVFRTRDFVQAIKPHALNIIDFIGLTEKFWEIDLIYQEIITKLTTGICWVMLQKNPSTKLQRVDWAPGGHFTEDRTSLYLVLENNTLRIKKAKKPTNPGVNPNNMKFSYQFNDRTQFINVQRVSDIM